MERGGSGGWGGNSRASRVKTWPALLTREGLEHSAAILRLARAPDLAELVKTVADRQGTRQGATTRQALHARLQRMQTTITAGALLLATREDAFQDFVMSKDFALLRPISAGTHLKVGHLIEQLPLDPVGAQRLFERCFSELLRLARPFAALTRDEALRVNGLIVGMMIAPVLLGPACADQWSTAMAQARAAGLFENPYIQMQMLLMGSFVGNWREHSEWLLDPSKRPVEMADIYLFVRRDSLPEIFDLQVRQIRGEIFPGRECLYSPRPCSTLNLLLDYACGCMRDTGHLDSPGLALMLLHWLKDLRKELQGLSPAIVSPLDRRSIEERLAKVERIQIMEKRRFWNMVDQLSPSALRVRAHESMGGLQSRPCSVRGSTLANVSFETRERCLAS